MTDPHVNDEAEFDTQTEDFADELSDEALDREGVSIFCPVGSCCR